MRSELHQNRILARDTPGPAKVPEEMEAATWLSPWLLPFSALKMDLGFRDLKLPMVERSTSSRGGCPTCCGSLGGGAGSSSGGLASG